MCAGALAIAPAAMAMNHVFRDSKPPDTLNPDKLAQQEKYIKMSDEERTRYEIKWAQGHGWGGNAKHGSKRDAHDFFRSHGYDKDDPDFDYTKTYQNMPRPKWMRTIYEDLRKKGLDQREEVAPINPHHYGPGKSVPIGRTPEQVARLRAKASRKQNRDSLSLPKIDERFSAY